MLFTIFILVLASAWATIGLLLAKWLKQSGHARPFTGRNWSDRELYGGGVGFGRVAGVAADYNHSEEYGRRLGNVSGERDAETGFRGMPAFGRGRVKGV